MIELKTKGQTSQSSIVNLQSEIGNRQLAMWLSAPSSRQILHRLTALLQHRAVPDKTCARVGSQFKVLRQLET